MSSVWETLSKVDVSDHTEEKNGLTYLSWAWAWGEVKNNFPQAKYVKHIWNTETYLDNPDRPDRGCLLPRMSMAMPMWLLLFGSVRMSRRKSCLFSTTATKLFKIQIAFKSTPLYRGAWQNAVQCMA